MATIDVKDAAGSTVALEKPLAAGQAAMAASRPVVIASNQSAVPVTGTITAVTALTNALPAGTNAIGKLAANSGVDIGDVDVTTLGGQSPAYGSGANGATVLRVGLATDSPGIIATGTAGIPSAAFLSVQGDASMSPIAMRSPFKTCTTDITRPADANAYTANDAWSDSTSAPTTGGFTFTGAGRISGGSGIITDILIISSAVPGTLLQGELFIFDSAATAINDNAAFALSDADAKLAICAPIAFTLVANASNSQYHAMNLNIGFTCVGSANLRYLVKVKNAYTPISAEVLTVRAKIVQVD